MTIHPIAPVFDISSRILILGSFPSVKSREETFFYAHPANRFWRVIASVCGEGVPKTISEKKALLIRRGIALWDVIGSCEIVGSSDSSIKNVLPNDISIITGKCDIKKIFLNGKTAEKFFQEYTADKLNIPFAVLPSTSPANASYSYNKLLEVWRKNISLYVQQ